MPPTTSRQLSTSTFIIALRLKRLHAVCEVNSSPLPCLSKVASTPKSTIRLCSLWTSGHNPPPTPLSPSTLGQSLFGYFQFSLKNFSCISLHLRTTPSGLICSLVLFVHLSCFPLTSTQSNLEATSTAPGPLDPLIAVDPSLLLRLPAPSSSQLPWSTASLNKLSWHQNCICIHHF